MRDGPGPQATASDLFLERHSTDAWETFRMLDRRSPLRQMNLAWAQARTALESQVLEISSQVRTTMAQQCAAHARFAPLLREQGSRR